MHHDQEAFVVQPRTFGEAGTAIVLGGGDAKQAEEQRRLQEGGGAGSGSAGGSGAASGGSTDQCHVDPNNEYHGDVVTWGDKNMQVSHV